MEREIDPLPFARRSRHRIRAIVPSMTFQPPNQPDPVTVFDSPMARGESFTQHPQGISSVLFYLAIIITHGIFQKSPEDHNVNIMSSCLDLSPFYGRNEEKQRGMRVFTQGLVKPDCFSSKRILGFPPGVGVPLVIFNRFHNDVVTQLAKQVSYRFSCVGMQASYVPYFTAGHR